MGAVRRTLSLWLGIWFVFVVAEPVPVHDCPMHNPLVRLHGGTHAEPQSPDAHSGHGAARQGHSGSGPHAGHGDHTGHSSGSSQTDHSSGHPSQGGAHYCLCLGCAAGSAPSAGAKAAAMVPVPVKIARLQAVYPLVERSALEPDFLLPPSTAPPTLS